MGTLVRVVKAEGTGNDFVIVFDPDGRLDLDEDLVRRVCDRRRGIGADGVIRLVRAAPDRGSGAPVFFMDYRNADGSRAEMCGNGIRCAARYLLKRGVLEGPSIPFDTRAGRKVVVAMEDSAFAVDMGPVNFHPEAIGADLSAPGVQVVESWGERRPAVVRLQMRSASAAAGRQEYVDTHLVGMGNPHAVVVCGDSGRPDLDAAVRELGPQIENHPAFPKGTNVEFIAAEGGGVRARVWERGVGETLSCGTGACAAGVVAMATGRASGNRVRLRFPGGDLVVSWAGSVILEGPAVEVFEAEVDMGRLGRA